MDLFISYSSRDRPFVEQLARDLDHIGLKVWWDQWQLDVGDSLAEKIQEGILTSAWLGVVLSPNSVESPWVKRELSAALAEEMSSDTQIPAVDGHPVSRRVPRGVR